jgi:transcriptional regulator with XRE-family HTH domain
MRGDGPVAEQSALSFAGLLRRLRNDAGLTQEELAEAASLSPRSVSDLERGVNQTARHDTARLLAGALGLTGPQRALFEAAARGRARAGQVLAAGQGTAAATRTLPRDIASFTGRAAELAQLAGAVRGAVAAGVGVVGIHAIGGMAGVGKTAFAVHAAHRLAGELLGAWPRGRRCVRASHWRPCGECRPSTAGSCTRNRNTRVRPEPHHIRPHGCAVALAH